MAITAILYSGANMNGNGSTRIFFFSPKEGIFELSQREKLFFNGSGIYISSWSKPLYKAGRPICEAIMRQIAEWMDEAEPNEMVRVFTLPD
jgi:hypothetical protein